MGIGGGVVVAAIGAILAWAVTDHLSWVDLHAVGIILLIAGIVLALLDAAVLMPRRRRVRADAVQPVTTRRDYL